MTHLKKGHRQRITIIDEKGKEREPYVEGFDPIAFHFTESYLTYANNRKILNDYKDEMDPRVIEYWESFGVKKELFDQDTLGKYSVHTPLDMDYSKRYPVLYYSHGGNGTPYEAETVGFSKLIQKELLLRFIHSMEVIQMKKLLQNLSVLWMNLKRKTTPLIGVEFMYLVILLVQMRLSQLRHFGLR